MKANVRKAVENAKIDATIRFCLYVMILVVNGKFGFGKKRLQELADEFVRTTNDYINRYGEVALDALRKHVEDKGINIEEVRRYG